MSTGTLLQSQCVKLSKVAGQVPLLPQKISFYNVAPERVRLEVTVCNPSQHRSEPTLAVVRAAPLGVFVPWRPLRTLSLPALEPGEQIVMREDVPAVRPQPLGDFAGVPPRKLLAALAADDDAPQARSLPPDPLELLGRGNPHWAGNLNLFVGRRAKERHLARALRIYPGRTNLALFFVGERRDWYRFRLKGSGAAWEAALFDATWLPSLLINAATASPVRLGQWIRADGCRIMILAVRPPAECRAGTVKVHVVQKSTRKKAVVEFSLDPEAAGPGCYVA